ncbi:MAG TPA: hypothetical protein VFH67_07630 [bacterium]|nr:hypothetical protein [bacterium]
MDLIDAILERWVATQEPEVIHARTSGRKCIFYVSKGIAEPR